MNLTDFVFHFFWKYKDLEIEITKIRRVKTEIVPVIVSELALISKGSSII